jgi:hypothetical protein
VCASSCFHEVRNTEALKHKLLVPNVLLYFASHKGISSHMMGDVALEGNLPHSMMREFSCVMELQRAWGDFVLTTRNTSYPLNSDSWLGVVWNRTEMSSHLNLEQADEGNWRRGAILLPEDLSRRLAHKCLVPGGGGSLEGVLWKSDRSGNYWLWCHSGLTVPGTWTVLRQLLPGVLLWPLRQPSRMKVVEGSPVLCERLLS